MSNIENVQSGERLSFYKLFHEKKYRVLIPIIQRDYAHGRKTSKEVRDAFLKALYRYLDENKPNRDLDFVYGSLSKTDDIVDFIPLDGQQRLTTLFLLHWYLFQISDNAELKVEFKNALLKDNKSLFSYETRSSSKEFCDELMNNNIDFDSFIEPDVTQDGQSIDNILSKTIKNSPWFFLSWQYDPTIQSMLSMLDAIHSKFANKKEFFERLLDIKKPIITFFFLNLRDFKLTDDLYIKMNSRGLPLSPFENFKAKYEQYLEQINTEVHFKLVYTENGKDIEKEVSIQKYFSYNIDTKWANLFWNYRTLQNRSKTERDETFDDELMNFIRIVFTNKYAGNTNIALKEKDDKLEYLLGTNVAKNVDYSDIISYHKYKELEVIFDNEEKTVYQKKSQKCIDENEKASINEKMNELNYFSSKSALFLINALDTLHNGNDKIKTHLSSEYCFYFDEHKVFENALRHSFESNHQRLCFHAYLSFLIYNKKSQGINQWMRLIHNLTHPENTVIDNASEFASACKSIDNLIPHSSNILEFLTTNAEKVSFFSSWQLFEEKIKAHLILKANKWKDEIERIEKHRYFNSQIGFILEFAGVIEYYSKNKNLKWNSKKDDEYFNKFIDYSIKASKVFEESYDNRKNNKNYVFERAVLTKGNYLTSASQWRYNLLSTNLVKNNIKRDHSWKRLLRWSEDKDWMTKRGFVKEVFDDKRFNIKSMIASLELICKDRTNTWRDYFIKYPYLIEYCKQGFIRYEDEDNILLYSQSQSNFPHAEMYSYFFWKEHLEKKPASIESFKKMDYYHVKSINEYACICLNEFTHRRVYYEIKIYFLGSPNVYEITFSKSKGNKSFDNYEVNLTRLLKKFTFKWNKEQNYFHLICKGINNTKKNLKDFTTALKKLK